MFRIIRNNKLLQAQLNKNSFKASVLQRSIVKFRDTVPTSKVFVGEGKYVMLFVAYIQRDRYLNGSIIDGLYLCLGGVYIQQYSVQLLYEKA